MGDVGLAYSFTTYFPIILSVLCLFTLFDVYDKVLTMFGLGKYRFTEEVNDDKVEEGKKLLYRGKWSVNV